MSLIDEFIQEYKNIFPNGDINDKDYKTTIIRNIIIYFLFKSYKKKKIKRQEILFNFTIKHKSNIYNKVNTINCYIDNPKILSNQKPLFTHFYYKFKKIYIDYENKN